MDLLFLSRIFLVLAFFFSVIAFGWRLWAFIRLARPADNATPIGNRAQGILYAYTLGMAPWAKESTRLHWAAYLRGIAFHAGIFAGLAVLVCEKLVAWLPEPFRPVFGILLLVSAGLGLAGLVMRFSDPNLKAITTPDDLFAVLVVSLFLGLGGVYLLYQPAQAVFYLVGSLMLVYAPFSKIRHCLYYAFARLFYGRFVGGRGVLPHSQQKVTHG
jgi:hypothetical protein